MSNVSNYGFGVALEFQVRGVFNHDIKGGFGGLIDSKTFEAHPFYAALIGLSRYLNVLDENEVSAFIDKYWDIQDKTMSDMPYEQVKVYCEDLIDLISKGKELYR